MLRYILVISFMLSIFIGSARVYAYYNDEAITKKEACSRIDGEYSDVLQISHPRHKEKNTDISTFGLFKTKNTLYYIVDISVFSKEDYITYTELYEYSCKTKAPKKLKKFTKDVSIRAISGFHKQMILYSDATYYLYDIRSNSYEKIARDSIQDPGKLLNAFEYKVFKRKLAQWNTQFSSLMFDPNGKNLWVEYTFLKETGVPNSGNTIHTRLYEVDKSSMKIIRQIPMKEYCHLPRFQQFTYYDCPVTHEKSKLTAYILHNSREEDLRFY